MSETENSQVIAVLGGTGAEGSGLAYQWARAGRKVIIGSRDVAKALQCASGLNSKLEGLPVAGMSNSDAAAAADVVVLTVPYSVQQETVLSLKDCLAGKVLIDVTVPLAPPLVDRVALPNGESAVAALQKLLGNSVRVVAAFQNISAHYLQSPDHTADCDVLICGDDAAACEIACELAHLAGFRGILAGPIVNAVAVEALTSLLIFVNKRYKVKGAGIRITGIQF